MNSFVRSSSFCLVSQMAAIASTTEKIYVIQCESDKWYIGKTSKPLVERMEEHKLVNGNRGAQWTKHYKPLSIELLKDNPEKYDEDALTLEYMEKYGIDNVRGGIYSHTILTVEEIAMIQKKMRNANGACFKCGKMGHFAKHCRKNKPYCTRCKRDNHTVNQCYAKTDKTGAPLHDSAQMNLLANCIIQ